MHSTIKECDMWLFGQVYAVLACFADLPKNSINRIGNGLVGVPDDQANELEQMLKAILSSYPHAKDFAVIRIAKEMDAIFGRYSLHGDLFDAAFWTNEGFEHHEGWQRIRSMAREFLLG